MTTPERAAIYEAQHLMDMYGRKIVSYNPHNKPLEDLPRIYGFNNGGRDNFLQALAIAEDGKPLGSHICSSESYMEGDLGILEGTYESRHIEDYRPHYPDGYVMEFVPSDKIDGHIKLQATLKLASAATTPTKQPT